jgi:hypothetical protein
MHAKKIIISLHDSPPVLFREIARDADGVAHPSSAGSVVIVGVDKRDTSIGTLAL